MDRFWFPKNFESEKGIDSAIRLCVEWLNKYSMLPLDVKVVGYTITHEHVVLHILYYSEHERS